MEDKTIIRSSAKVYALKGLAGDHKAEVYPLAKGLKIGREQDNDLIINEGFVSRHHATIKSISGVLTVTDNDSSNGTFVNDQAVNTSLLVDGDILKFDIVEFQVVEFKESVDWKATMIVPSQSENKSHEDEQAGQLNLEQKLQQQQVEQERLAAAKADAEKAEQEKLVREQAEHDLAEQERLAKAKAEQEKAEQERLTREQAERDLAEQERLAREQAERDLAEQERLAKAKADAEKSEQERLAREQSERDLAEQEKAVQERRAKEQAADADKTIIAPPSVQPAVTAVDADQQKTIFARVDDIEQAKERQDKDNQNDTKTVIAEPAPIAPVQEQEEKTIIAPQPPVGDEDKTMISPAPLGNDVSTLAIGQDAVTKIKEAAAANPTDVVLLGITDPVANRKFNLNKSLLIVGRSPFNDIIVKASSVSSEHAELEKIDDVWVIRDLGSSNGTYVNDQMIEECELYSDDCVMFGEVEFTFDPDGLMPPPEDRVINYLDEDKASTSLKLWLGIGVGVIAHLPR